MRGGRAFHDLECGGRNVVLILMINEFLGFLSRTADRCWYCGIGKLGFKDAVVNIAEINSLVGFILDLVRWLNEKHGERDLGTL